MAGASRGSDGQGEEVEEEDDDSDAEGQGREEGEFKKRRAGHYGGEAEAMKLAQVSVFSSTFLLPADKTDATIV
jgi:hypothetical protein